MITSTLTLTPSTTSVTPQGTVTLGATGGVPPYTYSVTSGLGTISNNNNLYTAPSTAGTGTIQVKDSAGEVATTTIQTTDTPILTLSANVVVAGGTLALSASGGLGPYQYSATFGQINNNTNTYTAPSNTTSDRITVRDQNGITASTEIQINKGLAIATPFPILYPGESETISISGGVPPYNCSVDSGQLSSSAGSGTSCLSTEVYSAPSVSLLPGNYHSATITVSDAANNMIKTTVLISGKLSLPVQGLQYTSGMQESFSNTFYTGSLGVLAYALPTGNNITWLYPTFIFGGATYCKQGNGLCFGPNTLGSSYGPEWTSSNFSLIDTVYFPLSSNQYFPTVASQLNDPSPYVGTLNVVGKDLAYAFTFCIQNSDPNAYLAPVAGSSYIGFGPSGSQFLGIQYPKSAVYNGETMAVDGGTTQTDLILPLLKTPSATPFLATVSLSNLSYPHKYNNCSSYMSAINATTIYQLSSTNQ